MAAAARIISTSPGSFAERRFSTTSRLLTNSTAGRCSLRRSYVA